MAILFCYRIAKSSLLRYDMEEIGIVKQVVGAKALVAVQKQSACDKCAAGSICKALGDSAEIEAVNDAHARVGDTVRILFKPYTYLKGTLLIYGLPALSLVIGAVVGREYVSKLFIGADPDIVSALCGFGLMVSTFVVVRIVTKRYEGRKEVMPVIEEIIRPL